MSKYPEYSHEKSRLTKPVNTEQLLPINPGDYHENIYI